MDKTLIKGLTLLEVLARGPSPRGVSDLAQATGLTRSNAHRTLQTLVAAGYARQCPDGRYDCSLKVFELGNAVIGRIDVASVAGPFIQALAEKSEETVHLSVLDDTDVVYVQKIDSPQPVRAYSRVGGRAPASCVATGKALLAFQAPMGAEQISRYLYAHTPHSITDPTAFAAELDRIRRQGYAINRGEWRESVCGLAAPIFDATGQAVAGVGISGPRQRLTVTRLRAFSGDVLATASAISGALGYSGAGHSDNARGSGPHGAGDA
ncbi:IclR family transcriptional regulator [Fodinicurvata sp. EGI_FJ10296]|uniref:IclR family transcriptional regulator n=1 Tax=Fodinicurvata sp. EGI_FJ10296 TaxID=3231908 RepID=UPI003454D3C0